MKVWMVFWSDEDGIKQSWHRSQAQAKQEIRSLEWDQGIDSKGIGMRMEEIPTRKDLLVEWLNRNFNTDNG